jgi:hypothetical protein
MLGPSLVVLVGSIGIWTLDRIMITPPHLVIVGHVIISHPTKAKLDTLTDTHSETRLGPVLFII